MLAATTGGAGTEGGGAVAARGRAEELRLQRQGEQLAAPARIPAVSALLLPGQILSSSSGFLVPRQHGYAFSSPSGSSSGMGIRLSFPKIK
jgi:hypothetical protein